MGVTGQKKNVFTVPFLLEIVRRETKKPDHDKTSRVRPDKFITTL